MNELAPARETDRTFLTYRAQGRLFGLDVAHVREVSTHVTVTPVPQAPALVRGLLNLRSRIYLVLDFNPVLGGAPSVCTSESRLIVLQSLVAENVGLLVEQGGEIVRVPAEQIEDARAAESSEHRAPSAVVSLCKLDGELMMVVDPHRIVAALETAIR